MKKFYAVFIAFALLFALCACNSMGIDGFSVTFDSQNGTEPVVVSVSNFTMPQDPTREGYVFGGWYTDEDCTDGNKWQITTNLTKNITVYAKWTAEDGGTDDDGDTSDTFADIAAFYADITTWNFVVSYDARSSSSVWFDDILKYVKGDFAWEYEADGATYVDYLAYDETKEQYAYYYDNGDGTYTRYYSEDDESDFNECYLYTPDMDLTVLGDYKFTLQGDAYVADSPIDAANYILGDWGYLWEEMKIYVSDGKISEITAVLLDNTSATVVETYNFTINFYDYGKASFTLPDAADDSDDDDGGETTSSKSVFTDEYLSTSNSSAVQYQASKTPYGFDTTEYERGVQFLQSAGTVTLTSTTSVSSVTKVTVGVSTNADNGMSVSVKVGSVAFTCDGSTSVNVSKGSAVSDLTFQSSTAASGTVSVTLTPKSSKSSSYISYIEINGGGSGGGSTPTDLSQEENFVGWNQSSKASGIATGPLQEEIYKVDRNIGLPSIGTYDCLVVPVQFSDTTVSPDDLSDLNLAFNGTAAQTGWQSVSSFYKTSSFGKLNLNFNILGYNIGVKNLPYISSHSSSYYANLSNDNGITLLEEVLNYLAGQTIDLSHYDTNGDGYIDAVYLIYSHDVVSDGSDTLWWAFTYWDTNEVKYQNLGVNYYLFAGLDFMYETNNSAASVTVNAETYIHETGHLLGLDDYYDYYLNKGSNQGLGGADMMDENIGDHGVYSKIMLGWMEPTVVSSTQTITLDISDDATNTTNNCVLIHLDNDNTYFSEYLLVDLYSATGLNEWKRSKLYDNAACGVRIYHVSSSIDDPYNNDYQSFTDNNNSISNTALIRLVEADTESNNHSTKSSSKNIYESQSTDLWQTTSDTFGNACNYKTNNGNTVNFNIKVTAVSETSATVTITFVA